MSGICTRRVSVIVRTHLIASNFKSFETLNLKNTMNIDQPSSSLYLPNSFFPAFQIVLKDYTSNGSPFTNSSTITYRHKTSLLLSDRLLELRVVHVPTKKPALLPSVRMFMCCWHAYTIDSSCSEDSLVSSMVCWGSLRSNHT